MTKRGVQSSYEELFDKMSAQLRGDTALIIGMETLSRVWYFSGRDDFTPDLEREFLAVVSLNMKAAVYEAKELLPVVDLTVITKGIVAINLVMKRRGRVLGVDCIIEDAHAGLRDTTKGRCVSFVQTSFITRETIFELVHSFPRAKRTLRRASRRILLRAGFRCSIDVLKLIWHEHGYRRGKRNLRKVIEAMEQADSFNEAASEDDFRKLTQMQSMTVKRQKSRNKELTSDEAYIDLMHARTSACQGGGGHFQREGSGSFKKRRAGSSAASGGGEVGGPSPEVLRALDEHGLLLSEMVEKQQALEEALHAQLEMMAQLLPAGATPPAAVARFSNSKDKAGAAPATAAAARPAVPGSGIKGAFGGFASRRSMRSDNGEQRRADAPVLGGHDHHLNPAAHAAHFVTRIEHAAHINPRYIALGGLDEHSKLPAASANAYAAYSSALLSARATRGSNRSSMPVVEGEVVEHDYNAPENQPPALAC